MTKNLRKNFAFFVLIFLSSCKSSGSNKSHVLSSPVDADVIELYSGTFDPPHLGHTMVAAQAAETLHAKKIYVIPNPANPAKPQMLPYATRIEMAKLAFNDIPGVSIGDPELLKAFQRDDITPVIQILKIRHPGAQFYQIFGDDVLERPTLSLKDDGQVNYLVAYRNGQATLPHLQHSKIQMFKLPSDPGCSSGKVKTEIKQGNHLPVCLSPDVADYISDHHLYQ